MSVSRPARLAVGDEVGLRGSTYVISAVAEGRVALTGVVGEVLALPVAELLADPSFTLRTRRTCAPLPSRAVLEVLPADVVERAQWWERHVTEVLTGVPAGSPSGMLVRAEYDPLRTSLRQREITKIAELEVAGESVSLANLGRLRRAYRAHGLLGLVGGRVMRTVGSAVDERVTAAIEKAVADETDRSTGTVTRLRRKVAQILAAEYGIDPGEIMLLTAPHDVLPPGRAGLARPAHVRVGTDAPVVGATAGRAVRCGDGAATGRVVPDRLHPVGRAGGPG